MAYNVIRIADIYEAIGEVKLKSILKDFECDLNKDVEYFLKEKSIEFFKSDISQTFIVTSSYQAKEVIVGYFAIANKSTKIKKSYLNANWRRRINRFASKDESDEKYFTISLPLIGQIGKNYKNGYNE